MQLVVLYWTCIFFSTRGFFLLLTLMIITTISTVYVPCTLWLFAIITWLLEINVIFFMLLLCSLCMHKYKDFEFIPNTSFFISTLHSINCFLAIEKIFFFLQWRVMKMNTFVYPLLKHISSIKSTNCFFCIWSHTDSSSISKLQMY